MVDPIVVPRSQHTLSRRDIDPDALKVLYRLHQADFVAYLVGGSVRDLLLGRRPKDFDIGTSAHPYQIKRLFRNCWIIGRRFRLAHVKFGTKTIEVATFRRQVPAGSEAEPPARARRRHAGRADGAALPADARPWRDDAAASTTTTRSARPRKTRSGATSRSTRSSTTSRRSRSSTTSAASRICERRVIRCIGDPDVRFQEDPVRMLRAIVPGRAPRLHDRRAGLRRDPRAQGRDREERPGAPDGGVLQDPAFGLVARAFRALGATGLLQHISPEIPAALTDELEASLDALDTYRRRFDNAPTVADQPRAAGLADRAARPHAAPHATARRTTRRRTSAACRSSAGCRWRARTWNGSLTR